MALQMLSGVVSDRKGCVHLCPNRSCRPCTVSCQGLILHPCEAEQKAQSPCLPTFHSVQYRLTRGQIFASKAKYTTDVLLHSPALRAPRYIFVSVNLHISAPSLVCMLHSFFQSVLRPSCLIESVSQKSETLLVRYFVPSCSRADRDVVHHLVGIRACPPQTCWIRLHVLLLSRFSKVAWSSKFHVIAPVIHP